MGDSRPPEAAIDLVNSYARRRAEQVEVVLADPQLTVRDAPVLLLRRRQKELEAPARLVDDDRGRRLVATVPAGSPLRGIWSLLLGDAGTAPDDEPKRIEARLLVQGPHRPVVLLWGRRSRESMLPNPHPREPEPVSGSRAVARRALALLPERRADQVRRGVAKLRARRG